MCAHFNQGWGECKFFARHSPPRNPSLKQPTMELVFLGSTGLKVSTLALGTMTFGEVTTSATQCTREESRRILDAYVAAGGNFIDTADVYQKGESEKIIGEWLALHPELRSKVVLATKCRGAVDPATAGPNDVGLSRAHIQDAVKASLARLQTTYIDLLQAHVWDEGTPIDETLRAFDDLVRAGTIRYYGFSNTTGWQTQLIVDAAKRLGISPPASLQEQYSLLCRQTEWEVTEVCERENVALLPWSPLKGGWLSGKVTRETTAAPEGSRLAWAESTGAKMQSHPSFSAFKDDERALAVIDSLQAVAKEAGGTVAQVAIRWLLQKRSVASVVIGAKSVAQLHDNLGAAKLRLTEDQMARLDAASAIPAPYPYEMVSRLQAGRKRPVTWGK
jgi:aryl-alcohol dehydrogenase-like predicted oxidoreductase